MGTLDYYYENTINNYSLELRPFFFFYSSNKSLPKDLNSPGYRSPGT
jgi:hypothetical protein